MPLDAPRLGLDLVTVARVRRALESHGDAWRRRVFTAAEWQDAHQGADPAAALALCFAAKEAAFKALGTGWAEGVGWRDVALRTGPQTAASLVLTGRYAELAAAAVLTLTVSVAHSAELALALVLGQGAA